jgi:isopentenyl-diphosphate Delta-isomerase
VRIPRKMQHVQHALALGQSGDQGFQDVKLTPNSLPETSTDQISLQTTIGELTLSSPIVINAMTGGAAETEEINRELAIAARETGLAMAVGSQMAAIKNPEVTSSYKVVREVNPTGLVFGNLGSEASVEQALQAVEMLRADALQIHLNVMQELIMPEGDRDFRGRLERIRRIVERSGVPVIVKEVGFGMTKEDIQHLLQAGVRIVDVGGAGGTNFAAIENARRTEPLEWLNDWGCTTCTALLEALEVKTHGMQPLSVIASGGLQTGMDIVKALTLGADAVGMAGALLRILRSDGTEALIQHIRRVESDIRLLMTALGAGDTGRLRHHPVIIYGDSAAWCDARGIDFRKYARRTGIRNAE